MDANAKKKLLRQIRKLNGLCQKCGKLNSEKHGPTCGECREAQRCWRNKKSLDKKICSMCHMEKEDHLKYRCNSCLHKSKIYNFYKRQTNFGKWVERVRVLTRGVAKGKCASSSYFFWSHEDFCKAFPEYCQSGKQIDHIIPLACAESSLGTLDEEFGKLVIRLENLQLLTCSENNKKAANIERQIKARAKDLRQQGKSGADLFHQLWAEFAWPQRQEG